VAVISTWPNFPPAQQCHYLANISPSHYPSPNHPHRLAAHPMPYTTLNTNQDTNQGGNIPAKKPVEFTPILVSYAYLLPYLLDNSILAITPAKVPQPLFFRGYDSNTTCVYHCRNLPFGGRATRGLTGASSMGGRCTESPPTFI